MTLLGFLPRSNGNYRSLPGLTWTPSFLKRLQGDQRKLNRRNFQEDAGKAEMPSDRRSFGHDGFCTIRKHRVPSPPHHVGRKNNRFSTSQTHSIEITRIVCRWSAHSAIGLKINKSTFLHFGLIVCLAQPEIASYKNLLQKCGGAGEEEDLPLNSFEKNIVRLIIFFLRAIVFITQNLTQSPKPAWFSIQTHPILCLFYMAFMTGPTSHHSLWGGGVKGDHSLPFPPAVTPVGSNPSWI